MRRRRRRRRREAEITLAVAPIVPAVHSPPEGRRRPSCTRRTQPPLAHSRNVSLCTWKPLVSANFSAHIRHTVSWRHARAHVPPHRRRLSPYTSTTAQVRFPFAWAQHYKLKRGQEGKDAIRERQSRKRRSDWRRASRIGVQRETAPTRFGSKSGRATDEGRHRLSVAVCRHRVHDRRPLWPPCSCCLHRPDMPVV